MKRALKLLSSGNPSAFRRVLLSWYDKHQRALPWRGESDGYRIWVSEIMLQQTRVAVVQQRYGNFLRRFPDLRSLARARLPRVLAEWSGLGYYRRARNLHAAARILARRGGPIPRTAVALAELPGIGRYTAAAISSIAFGEPRAAVDGNVERVVERLLGGTMDPWQAAALLLDAERPGDFNQAMMELGATTCLPAKPRCQACPVAKFCGQCGQRLKRMPTRRRKQAKQAYLLLRRGSKILLQQRPASARLMPGMWELPSAHRRGGKVKMRLRHSITDTDYHVSVFASEGSIRAPLNGIWLALPTLQRSALTGLTRKILQRLASETNL